ncbi:MULTISPECIES: hypothetical protein [unclassified Exiguobacterium]|uniref:Uncharacterized protein n=1 Tax=Exiguobacterium sp. (strain ATCC BAA-1283 / AT1b) TaxID=360911 RepID=C4L143_EXISA|nr:MULTISPECIES: hypothetical protein [unclassified Exiguobacterium]ACQ68989.1 hypothetical protein EAT1b_0054 [Exiguobacterium sp. AT1b]
MEGTVNMATLHTELQTLKSENLELKRRVGKLEESDERHEEDIRNLYAHQAATKAYVEQILSKIDGLETKLFNALTTSQRNSVEERNGWMEYTKYVIGATIGVVVLYLFQQQGGK